MKTFPLTRTLLLLALLATSAPAEIIFNPANPLNVVDQGGFTGTGTSAGDPYEAVRLRFNFSGLNPSPLLSSFQISNIFLKGPGITTSLSLGSITITGNGNSPFTSLVALNSTVPSLNYAGVVVSFNAPAGVINDGASFSTAVSYTTFDFDQTSTSATGPIFAAQSAAPIPEPGTWAAAALLLGAAGYVRWRRRQAAQ